MRTVWVILISAVAAGIIACCSESSPDRATEPTPAPALVGTWRGEVAAVAFRADGGFEQLVGSEPCLGGTFTTDETVDPHHLDITYTWCLKEPRDECPPLDTKHACFAYRIRGDTLLFAHDCDTDYGSRPTVLSDQYDLSVAVRN